MNDASGFGLPVLMLGFNRPGHFARVAAAVLEAHPSRLYVSLDGPRVGRQDDEQARHVLLQEVGQIRLVADVCLRSLDENLGAGGHVSSAITWFFEHEEFGVILEDDCLPSPSFFDFVRRVHDERPEGVTHIAGFTPAPAHLLPGTTMHRSVFPMTWGWATWREYWANYDISLGRDWRSRLPRSQLRRIGHGMPWFGTFWSRRFDELRNGSRDVWDYQWVYWNWVHGGITVTPNVNLVHNIGFGAASTHSYFARRAYRVPARCVSPSHWDLSLAAPVNQRQADRYLHLHFYKVNRLWPVTATARGLARRVVNRVLR
jgi:hypothetical protein